MAAETVDDAQRRGVAELAKLPPQRKTVAADVSLRLLGALHGTWTGEDHGDYEIVDTGIAIKTRIKRGGRMERTGHTTPATQALTEHLAAAGHRLLVFLPADRHAPFSHARDLTGPGPGPANPVVQSLLTLADAEIAGPRTGQVSDVHIALAKGIAIHSSAMVAEEQRACEIAFEREAATVMLATGTLAQGLNLPASAVIIGGTHVGDRREADTPAGRARAKSQLLNAVGRAGRAQTAARSLAIVVPANPVRIGLRPDVATARRAAPWLADEDGSAIVTSQLRDLIANTLNGSVDLVHMDVPEQTAFAFLSFTAESGDATNVLARTLAAHNANAADRAPQLTKSLRDLGRQYLDRNQAPAWIATSAHRAGIALPAAVAFERLLRWLLAQPGQPPDSIELWSQTIAWLLVYMPVEERTLLLGDDVLSATQVSGFESTDVATRTNAGRVLTDTLQSWLVGAPLVEVGRVLHDRSEPIAVTRGKGHDLPRTLRFVRDGIEHALTTVAGAILATVITGAEQEPSSVWNLPLGPMTTLTRLPVALRYGASSPAALALMQAGLRPRAAAHLIARLIPPPDDGDEITMALWRSRALRDIEDPDFIAAVSDPGDRETLRAAAHVRREG